MDQSSFVLDMSWQFWNLLNWNRNLTLSIQTTTVALAACPVSISWLGHTWAPPSPEALLIKVALVRTQLCGTSPAKRFFFRLSLPPCSANVHTMDPKRPISWAEISLTFEWPGKVEQNRKSFKGLLSLLAFFKNLNISNCCKEVEEMRLLKYVFTEYPRWCALLKFHARLKL